MQARTSDYSGEMTREKAERLIDDMSAEDVILGITNTCGLIRNHTIRPVGPLPSEIVLDVLASRILRARLEAAATFGIYRERARSAVLVQIVEGREAAMARAEWLSNSFGPHLVAAYDTGGTDWTRAHQDVIRYNDPTAPRAIHRAGDWDSRSAWQPYTTKG